MQKADILAVVPAAGVGRRMGGSLPKQYMDLLGVPVIVRTLRRIAGHRRMRKTVVALKNQNVSLHSQVLMLSQHARGCWGGWIDRLGHPANLA